MKIIVCIMAIVIMLIILGMLTLAGRIVELKEDLNKSNDYRKELDKKLDFVERNFISYKTELEKRIAKFNDNAYNYKEEVKNEFESINNKNKHFAMELGKLRNNYKDVVLNNQLTEHLEK